MEQQFDAVLYLGPPWQMTQTGAAPELCRDSQFVANRLERLQRFAPLPEVVAFRNACLTPNS